jgi:hypothetical protein
MHFVERENSFKRKIECLEEELENSRCKHKFDVNELKDEIEKIKEDQKIEKKDLIN